MRIYLSDLTMSPVQKELSWPCEKVRSAIVESDELVVQKPCRVLLETCLVDEVILCRGEVECKVEAVCSRCLSQTEIELGGPLDLAFRKRPRPSREDFEEESGLEEESESLYYFKGFADLEEPVAELIAMNVPMRILCSDDCKGLCPACGTNWNEGPCNCR